MALNETGVGKTAKNGYFRPINHYSSEMIEEDRHGVTIQDQYDVTCGLSIGTNLCDLEWPWTTVNLRTALPHITFPRLSLCRIKDTISGKKIAPGL